MAAYRFFLIAFLISSAVLFTVSRASEGHQAGDENPFSYGGEEAKGPKNWGTIKPEWSACGTGKMQSPIDMINERVTVLPSLGALKRNYKAANANITARGHDIAMLWEGDAGGLRINGTDYKLVNIHWHSPSEHTINGTRYALEGHMVHFSADHHKAVIGILYEFGSPDRFLAKFMKQIKTSTEEGINVGVVHPREIRFNTQQYYRYIGSLTSPPCTEGVIWTLLTKVRTVSHEQVHALKEAVHDGYEINARPLQELNGRTISLTTPK